MQTEANINKAVWHLSLHAVEAVWRLGAALQIDGMPESNIRQITYTENPPLSNFSIRANGTEQNPKYAVVHNAHEMLRCDNTNTIINTISNDPKHIYNLPVKSFKVVLSFVHPINISEINIPKLNYFVFVGTRVPRTEIHLSGYDHTNLSNSSEPLKENTGKFMWTIQIPQYFEYPHECIPITKAYPTFESWVTSGGSLHQDWYDHKKQGNLYTQQ